MGFKPSSAIYQQDDLEQVTLATQIVSQFSRSVVYDFLRPHGLQHARPLNPSPAPRVYSNSCPLTL